MPTKAWRSENIYNWEENRKDRKRED